MPRLSERDQEDVKILKELVLATDRILRWIVWESAANKSQVHRELAEVLPTASLRLLDTVRSLEAIDNTESSLWKGLDEAGLVGPPLRLKKALWHMASGTSPEGASEAARPLQKRTVPRVLKPLLTFLNSFLGSLASVFPALELVKEFKDGLELVVDHQQEWEPPPSDILGLRG